MSSNFNTDVPGTVCTRHNVPGMMYQAPGMMYQAQSYQAQSFRTGHYPAERVAKAGRHAIKGLT